MALRLLGGGGACFHRLLVQTPGTVGGADERSRHDADEADLFCFLRQLHKFLRFDPTVHRMVAYGRPQVLGDRDEVAAGSVSYTHLRAHETDSYLVCRLLLEKKKKKKNK